MQGERLHQGIEMKLIPLQKSTKYLPIMERLLDAGKVMVHLLPGLLGVRVPSNFRHERILRLNFSYRFGIADFQVDERGVRASLSFAGVPQFCDIPWGAVVALSREVTDEIYVWVEDFSLDQLEPILPPILMQQFRLLEEQAGEASDDASEDSESASDESEAEASDESEEGDDDDDIPPEGWGPLRLV